MWNFITFVSLALTWNLIQAANSTQNAYPNKTKRGLVGQTHFYGHPSAVKYVQTPVYHDSVSVATNLGSASNYFSNSQRPGLFHNHAVKTGENEHAKQVAVQQVLYEYQQNPYNAASNIHVNQQFQTPPAAVSDQRQYVPDAIHSQTSFPSTQINPHFVNQHHVLQVEPNQFAGIATPVQHGAVINHGQGYSKVFYAPFPAVQTTSGPVVQTNPHPKYIYANGKILYTTPHNNLHANNPYPGITVTTRPHNLVTSLGVQQRPLVTQKPFKPSPLIPITYGAHQAHPRVPAKPTETPVKEEVEEEEDDKSDVREESGDGGDSDDHSSYDEDEEDDFKPAYYSKYRYDDEDDDDHEGYREHEDEEDEDNTRSSSRHIRKKPKKYGGESKPGGRYHKNDHYKYREGFEANDKYSTKCKAPNECLKYDSADKGPKNQYKSYKFYKSSSDSKPRKEVIEGRQSQNVPIIHNKKLIRREKWLIMKKNSSE